MRRKETSTASFRRLLSEVSQLLAYEITRDMPLELVDIETPLMKMRAPVLAGKKIVLVSVLRAGNGLLDGMLQILPSARVGHVGLYRDPETLEAVEYYFKVPKEMQDPAVSRVKATGPRAIKFACLLAAPEGIENFTKAHPDVDVYTPAIDERLNDHGYILPGLGDAGDRIYGTV